MDDIEAMMTMGKCMKIYLLVCWYVATPVICVFITLIYWANFSPLKYERYTYPLWSSVLGWSIALSSCVAVPATAIYQLYKFRHNTSLVTTGSRHNQPHSTNQN